MGIIVTLIGIAILLYFILDHLWIIIVAVIGGLILWLIAQYIKGKKAAQEIEDRLAADAQNLTKRTPSVAPQVRPAPASSNEAKQTVRIEKDPLETFSRSFVFAPSVFQNCPMVYRYQNVSICNVDRETLRYAVRNKEFDVSVAKDDAGVIRLTWHGSPVGILAEKNEMCADWLDKGWPFKCELSAFAAGKEAVALFFYKDQESLLKGRRCEIAKLTSCTSADKQETISFLEKGEKLFVDWDDDNKQYLHDIAYNPIGRLPPKYTKYCEEELIAGVFFDHTETKEAEDWDKDDKLIPFVRVYIDE